MKDIIIIENIFDETNIIADEFNSIIIKKIKNHPGWHLSDDEQIEKRDIDSDLSDTGMLLQSFFRVPSHDFDYHSEVNSLAELIFQQIQSKLPIKFIKIELVRFLWNYYSRSSTGVIHRDINEETVGKFCSIVYHLNDSDGETVIDDSFIKSKSGQCIVFDSKRIHHGTGPKKIKNRYCLNIIFKYDSLIDTPFD